MNNVMSIKQKLLDRMAELDYATMNLMDLFTCINMLRSLADMPERSYVDLLTDAVGRMGCANHTYTEEVGLGNVIGVGGE